MGNFMRVLQCVVIILIMLVSACTNQYKRKVTIVFDRVDNLEIGSKAYMKGFPVGEVTSLDLASKGVLVDVRLIRDIQIPVNSKFSIDPSLFGSASIVIEPSGETTYLTFKDTSTGQYIHRKLLDHVVSDTGKARKFQQSIDKIGEGIKELLETSRDTANKY